MTLALLAGAGMALLSYAIMTQPIGYTISRYFLENAYSGGGGKNVGDFEPPVVSLARPEVLSESRPLAPSFQPDSPPPKA